MTEQEKEITRLYKSQLRARKSLREGKTNRDYEMIIYDLQEKINKLTNSSLSDGTISLQISDLKKDKVRFNIIELLYHNCIGNADIYLNGKKASLNLNIYNYSEYLKDDICSLSVIKLLCAYMKKNGIEEVSTVCRKDDYLTNNSLETYGSKKDSTKVGPYIQHKIKIK